jgi:hypothetical protein
MRVRVTLDCVADLGRGPQIIKAGSILDRIPDQWARDFPPFLDALDLEARQARAAKKKPSAPPLPILPKPYPPHHRAALRPLQPDAIYVATEPVIVGDVHCARGTMIGGPDGVPLPPGYVPHVSLAPLNAAAEQNVRNAIDATKTLFISMEPPRAKGSAGSVPGIGSVEALRPQARVTAPESEPPTTLAARVQKLEEGLALVTGLLTFKPSSGQVVA